MAKPNLYHNRGGKGGIPVDLLLLLSGKKNDRQNEMHAARGGIIQREPSEGTIRETRTGDSHPKEKPSF